MKSNRILITAVGVFVAAALLLSACSLSMPGQNSAAQATPTFIEPVVRDSQVMVEGRLVPNQFINLSFASGGRIKDLFVVEGSSVESGQVIARLDGIEQLESVIEAAKFEMLSAQQAIDTLNENYGVALAEAQRQLAQAKIDLEDAEEDRTSMVYRRASDSTLNALRADVILAQEELDNAQDYYDHHQYGDDLVRAQALSLLSTAQKARDRAQYNLNYASQLPEKNEIDKAEAMVKVASANLDLARANLERLANGPDAKTLALAEARLNKAQTDLNAAQTNLENLSLKAPFSGTIVELDIAQGEQVSPGVPVAILVDFSRWIVETSDLTELNVVDLQVGQKATLVADALPEETLTGVIERISNRFIEKQGDITYTVRVALDQSDSRLRWGMTFAVTLDAPETAATASQAQPQPAPTTIVEQEPTAAPEAAASAAEAALTSYFGALEEVNAEAAASLVSNFSLVAGQTSRVAVADAIQSQITQGSRWSEVKIKSNKVLDENTILFQVGYTLTARDGESGKETKTTQDEWWPVRKENGLWLVNWERLIDYRGLDLPSQTTAGLTVNPIQINRYPDRVRLVLFVQNRTNDTIVLGQVNEILAVFTFGDDRVEAEQAQMILLPQKTYPNTMIEVKGEFAGFPDSVEIRKWKNYQTAPWYTFEFGE